MKTKLSRRDKFAAMAMQGLLANEQVCLRIMDGNLGNRKDESITDGEKLSRIALHMADSLIAKLDNTDSNEKLLSIVDKLLAHCPIGECEECSKISCPYECPLHFHHDGCPACAELG